MSFFNTLFFLLWFTIPFGQLARLQITNDIAINVLDIVVIFLLLSWILKRKFFIQKFVFKKEIFIFWVICSISLLLNFINLTAGQFLISFLYLLRFIVYSSVYFIVSSLEKEEKKRVFSWMRISGFFIVFFGYIQYFFYTDLRNLYYLGWDEHIYRMFSTFLDPNFAGVFFVLYLLFVGNYIFIQKRKSIFWFGVLAITLGAVYLSFSRTALLMLFISVTVYTILIKKIRWVFVLAGISIGVMLISSRFFYIENINLLRTASSFARIDSMKDALIVIQKNPVLGVGFNAYRYSQIRYGIRDETTQYVSHSDAGTDNSYLFVWATTGIIGLLSFLYLWFRVIKMSWSKKLLNIQLVLPSVLGFLVSGLFINSLFFPVLILWIWSIIGLMENT